MRQPYPNELYHYGIRGQKWGIRRFQNPDGTYTAEGRKRYRNDLINAANNAYGYKTIGGHNYVRPYEETHRAERSARKIIHQTWDKEKIASLYEDLRKKQDEADKLAEIEWQKMMDDKDWRRETAERRAKGDKETFNYLYNIEGIDAASYMSEAWTSDSRHQPQGRKAEQASAAATSASRKLDEVIANEVNKHMQSVGINDFTVNKTEQRYVARLLGHTIRDGLYATQNAYDTYMSKHPNSNMTFSSFSAWYKGGS